MHVRFVTVCLGLILLYASTALAYEFQPLGFESIGMGGAGVASASGPMAPYYNPALLTENRHPFEFNLGVGAALREYNLAEQVDRLNELDLQQMIGTIASNHDAPAGSNPTAVREGVVQAMGILTDMSEGNNYLAVAPAIALGTQVKHLGVGLYLTSDAGATAIIRKDHLQLIVQDPVDPAKYYAYDPVADTYGDSSQAAFEQSSLQYALDHGLTYLHLGGLAVAEVPVSYARKFSLPIGAVSVGGSAKLLQADIFESTTAIDTNSGDVTSEVTDNRTTASSLGIDLGLLFTPVLFKNVHVGLVGKNLNSPHFKAGAAEYTIDPMFRLGACCSLLHGNMDIAADLDLTKNDTPATGASQYLGGGINYHPSSRVSVRAGIMNNLANSHEGTSLTGGIGIGLQQLQIDLAAMASTSTGSYDGKTLPRFFKVNLSLISRW